MPRRRQRCYACGLFFRPNTALCACCRSLVSDTRALELRLKRQPPVVVRERASRIHAHAQRVRVEMLALGMCCRATEVSCKESL